jgi:hypothetical protein
MRIAATILMGLSGILAAASPAAACDLEGFGGYTRINPFAQHAAWNVPADRQASQATQETQAQSASSTDQSRQTRTEANRSAAQQQQRQGFTPVSAQDSATQSQRFTATKD